MTPEQRYLLDASGYLHLENALSPAELKAAQDAVQRYVDTPADQLPPGFKPKDGTYPHAFAFDKALETLAVHPSTWPIVRELTADKPRFASGTMRVNTRAQKNFGPLHCAREGWGPQTPRYHVDNGRIYCDFFVCFVYGSFYPRWAMGPMLFYIHHIGLSQAELTAYCAGNLERILEGSGRHD